MNIENKVYNVLTKLGFGNLNDIKIKEIRNKDGVFLFRIIDNKNTYVLKYFVKDEYKREIANYKLLKKLGIKTIRDYGYTDNAILLEDLESSKKYRLGIDKDLKDKEVAKALATWYINLHNKGVSFAKDNKDIFYSEVDQLDIKNIKFIRLKSNTMDNTVWDLILNNFEIIKEKIYSLEQTLNYNDFYWTNLVVNKDKPEAFMFDYNFLGVGYRYSDIRNVCLSLSTEAGDVFIKEYGDINAKEEIIDNFTAIIINLIFSYKKEVFPSWGKESLDSISNGKLEKAVRKILGI